MSAVSSVFAMASTMLLRHKQETRKNLRCASIPTPSRERQGEKLNWDEPGRQWGKAEARATTLELTCAGHNGNQSDERHFVPQFQEEVRSTTESCSLSKWGPSSLVRIRK